MRNNKRKCETNRPSAYHITPKGVMWGIRHHIFFYQHLTPDGVMGGFIISVEIPTDG